MKKHSVILCSSLTVGGYFTPIFSKVVLQICIYFLFVDPFDQTES